MKNDWLRSQASLTEIYLKDELPNLKRVNLMGFLSTRKVDIILDVSQLNLFLTIFTLTVRLITKSQGWLKIVRDRCKLSSVPILFSFQIFG